MRAIPTLLAAADDPGLPAALHLTLLALMILGAAVWIGGMAAVVALAVSSSRVLDAGQRAALFRDFGRRYLLVAGTALIVTVVCGGILLGTRPWDALATAIVVVVAALVLALAAGVRQARAVGRLRRSAADPSDPGAAQARRDLPRRARQALLLRSLIGLLTAALFALAVCTAA